MFDLKTKNDLLVKENETIKVRYETINEILVIQENQIEQIKKFSYSPMFDVNERKKKCLLKVWRNKVFQLLVNLKDQEIRSNHEKNRIEKFLKESELLVCEQESQLKILRNLLENKKDELSQLNSEKKSLNELLNSLKDTNISLIKKINEDLHCSKELKQSIACVIQKHQNTEDAFTLADKKLTLLGQRIEFAKNRLVVLKDLKSAKRPVFNVEQKVKMDFLEMTSNLSSIHSSIEPNTNFTSIQDTKINLKNENNTESPEKLKADSKIENLQLSKSETKSVQERDLINLKLNSDIDLSEDRMKKMQNEFEFKIKTLNKNLKESKELNDLKQLELDNLNEVLNRKLKESQELQIKYDNLKNDFDNYKALAKTESPHVERIKEMEEKLNTAKRDQAKTLVIMRQLERSTNREKDRMEDLLKSTESYYNDYVNKLKSKIEFLEKEHLVLLNKIKQQKIDKESVNPENFDSFKNFNDSNSRVELENNNHLRFEKTILSEDVIIHQYANRLKSSNQSSFWLDQNMDDGSSLNNKKENHSNDSNSNCIELDKNSEILRQIRRIMGNLEMIDKTDTISKKDNEAGN
jgi:coiled-coil alpha-helical rod protein 1